MRRLAMATLLPLMALAGCQGVSESQSYEQRFGNTTCKDRAYDAGLCDQPSNFNLWGTIITGERQP
jgi:hypothetical protein